MSKLSFEKERITGTDKQKQNPFKVSTYQRRDDLREQLGTSIRHNDLMDWATNPNPLER